MKAPSPIVALTRVSKRHRREGTGQDGHTSALDTVSLTIARGEALGMVGETGSGRSTLGRISLALERPSAGEVRFEGIDLTRAPRHVLKLLRRHAQLVDGDPRAQLDPGQSIAASLALPLQMHARATRTERRQRIEELLDLVGLSPALASARPAALSPGQCQRVVIARAIALETRYLVLDQPTELLDPPIQAQILNLLAQLKQQFDLALMLITSDLRIARYLCDRIAVMHAGCIVEQGPAEEIWSRPRHPFTRALVAAVADPVPGSAILLARGDPPDPADQPRGCSFQARCPQTGPRCRKQVPIDNEIGGVTVACHLHDGGVEYAD